MKQILFPIALIASMIAFAEGGNPWTLTLGPAWRARVKSSISGAALVQGVPASHSVSYDKDIAGHGVWNVGEVEKVQDPDYATDPSMQKYAATRTMTETTVTPNDSWAGLSGSDIDRSLGVKAGLGYDFYSGERFSLGLGLKFAAFWNMRSSATGMAGGGSITINRTTDYYLFNNGPIPDDADFTSFYPDAEPYAPYQQSTSETTLIPASTVSAHIRSDLYQIGLGPRVTWHILDWLDAYGNVEVLCNIAHMEFDAPTSSGSDTMCLLGFGGNLGLSAYVTEHIGLYTEVGYEWIDESETNLGCANASVDFSSMIVSAGLIYRF